MPAKTKKSTTKKSPAKKTVVASSRRAQPKKVVEETSDEIQASITRALLGIIAISIFIAFFLNRPF